MTNKKTSPKIMLTASADQFYVHWVDDKDRDNVSGNIGKDKCVTLVTQPGYRITVKDGDYTISKVSEPQSS